MQTAFATEVFVFSFFEPVNRENDIFLLAHRIRDTICVEGKLALFASVGFSIILFHPPHSKRSSWLPKKSRVAMSPNDNLGTDHRNLRARQFCHKNIMALIFALVRLR